MHHAFIDKFSHLESPIHALDSRAKILSFFFFVFMVVLTAHGDFFSFSLFFSLLFCIFILSKVPFSYIFKHSLIVIPFAGFVAVSQLFTSSDLQIVFFGIGFNTSSEGLSIFLSILIKSWLSVLAMLTLVSTTPFPSLLKGLEWFKVPSLILMVISFMYRYIFLLTDELMRIKAARDSRGGPESFLKNLNNAGCIIGSLFVRSYERAERVFLAMCSRGFDGEIRTINSFSFRLYDVLFIFFFCICSLAINIFSGGNY